MIAVTDADFASLDASRGSLSAIIPDHKRLVTVGNGSEVHRVTEIVARGGARGDQLVANLHSVTTKQPKVHIPLHELLDVTR